MTTTTKSTLTYRDPAMLKVHPLAKGLHQLADEDHAFTSIVDSMIERGFDPDAPITITQHNLVVDGRHRWRAAKRAKLAEVPCVIIADDLVATVIIRASAARKHQTLSARAYDLFPILEPAYNELHARHVNRLKSGNQGPSPIASAMVRTVSDLAAQIGVSADVFQQAARVHEIFAQDPEYRAQMEPRIFAEPIGGELETNRPVGLGRVIAGWGGRKKTKDQARPAGATQLELFDQSWSTLKRAGKTWRSLDPRAQETVLDQFRTVAATMPGDLRQELTRILNEIES